MKKISMYIVAHKKFNVPKLDSYIPIQVGYNEENLFKIRDNTGDNISDKNKNYCELTAYYWIWENDDKSDIVGINHYRRYFTKNILKNNIISSDEIQNFFDNGYNMILSRKKYYDISLREQYILQSGYEKDLNALRKIIEKKYDKKMLECFDKVMDSNSLCPFNMLITTKNNFDEYCEFLFDTLFELENTIDISNYDDYHKRIYGFISERLLNVWVLYNQENLKIKYLGVISTEKKENFFYRILANYATKIPMTIAFKLKHNKKQA